MNPKILSYFPVLPALADFFIWASIHVVISRCRKKNYNYYGTPRKLFTER